MREPMGLLLPRSLRDNPRDRVIAPRLTDGMELHYIYDGHNQRIPNDRNVTPRFGGELVNVPALRKNLTLVGATGWEWQKKLSCWAGLDFDGPNHIKEGHEGHSKEEIQQVIDAARRARYAWCHHSKGGPFGVHVIVPCCPMVAEFGYAHAANVEAIISRLCDDANFDFRKMMCGKSVLYFWVNGELKEHAFDLLVEPTEEPPFIETPDPGESPDSKVGGDEFEPEHLADISLIQQIGYVASKSPHGVLSHSRGVQLMCEATGRPGFLSNAPGNNPSVHNCWLNPRVGGGWTCNRFNIGPEAEAPGWEANDRNFACRHIPPRPDMEMLAIVGVPDMEMLTVEATPPPAEPAGTEETSPAASTDAVAVDAVVIDALTDDMVVGAGFSPADFDNLFAATPKPTVKPNPIVLDFDENASLRFLLEGGWEKTGDTTFTVAKGQTARVVVDDGQRFVRVNSNGPMFPAHDYTPFDLYAILKHGSNAVNAALDLKAKGFGGQRIPTISSRELFTGDYKVEYLIDGVYVAKQPLVLAGPEKCLKTYIMLDFAVSAATQSDFLGCFPVKRPVSGVLVLSGESGLPTLKKNAGLICAARGLDPIEKLDNLVWTEYLPNFGSEENLARLNRTLAVRDYEIAVIDPAYLCVPGETQANVQAQGQFLKAAADVIRANGAALVLVHHTKKPQGKAEYRPFRLTDMAGSAYGEFFRQWIGLTRVQPYVEESGLHKLNFVTGGSAGHSKKRVLDIDEGTYPDKFRWHVQVLDTKAAATTEYAETTRDMLVRAAKSFPDGETKTKIFFVGGELRMDAKNNTVWDALVKEGYLTKTKVTKPDGKAYYGWKYSDPPVPPTEPVPAAAVFQVEANSLEAIMRDVLEKEGGAA